jgi:glycosyltransferase involved in cell wall biosynthesis
MPNGAPWPRISIVTPSYNQGQFIEQTIRSVLLQGYPNLEYIIVDGGSTDASVEIIKRYESWLAYWESEKDRGQSHAINKGLERATGQIFHWLNSDDYLTPGALQEVANMVVKHPDAVGWVGGCRRVDPAGNLLSLVIPQNLARDHLANWARDGFFYQPSCFFSAQTWEEVGPLDENLHCALDLDLWLRLSKEGEFVSTEKILSGAVIHPDAKTQAHRLAMRAETIHLQVKYGYHEIAVENLRLIRDRYRLKRRLGRIVWKGKKRLLKFAEKFSLLGVIR